MPTGRRGATCPRRPFLFVAGNTPVSHAPLEAELEAAHARGEWRISGEEIERRLGICRDCGDFLRHGCPVVHHARAFVALLVAERPFCDRWVT